MCRRRPSGPPLYQLFTLFRRSSPAANISRHPTRRDRTLSLSARKLARGRCGELTGSKSFWRQTSSGVPRRLGRPSGQSPRSGAGRAAQTRHAGPLESLAPARCDEPAKRVLPTECDAPALPVGETSGAQEPLLQADRLAFALRAAGERLALPLPRAARGVCQARSCEKFGYARLRDHARERFGRSGRWVSDLAVLAEAFESLPGLAEALCGTDG